MENHRTNQRHLLQSVPLRLVVLDDVGCVCHANPLQCTVPWPSAIYTLFGANSATSEILVQLACAWSPTESELPKNQSLPTIESFLKELIMIP